MSRFILGILASAALALCTSQAPAADLGRPVYRASPPVVAAYNWSGFYTGIMGGYAQADIQSTSIQGDQDGFFGGGTIGVNWQAVGSPWVWGVEADLAVSNIKGSGSTPVPGATVTASSEIDWFGTARLRAGYAWDRILLYATGGAVWANNEVNFGITVPGVAGITSSNTHLGWTAGGGLEWALAADGWTAKAEYLYFDLGSERYFSGIAGGFNADLTVHTVKLGLNYRWGGVAKY